MNQEDTQSAHVLTESGSIPSHNLLGQLLPFGGLGYSSLCTVYSYTFIGTWKTSFFGTKPCFEETNIIWANAQLFNWFCSRAHRVWTILRWIFPNAHAPRRWIHQMFDPFKIRRSSEEDVHDFDRSSRCWKLEVIDAVALIQSRLHCAAAWLIATKAV